MPLEGLTERRDEKGGVAQVVPPGSPLASFVRMLFNRAAAHKTSRGIEKRFVRALLARTGELGEDVKARLREAGFDDGLVSQITDVKCNAAKAQLDEVYVNGPNDEWSLSPTPVPDIPLEQKIRILVETLKLALMYVAAQEAEPSGEAVADEVRRRYDEMRAAEMAVAKERVARMEAIMRDQLEEGGFRDAKAGYVNDVVTYGTGFIEGPVERTAQVLASKKSKVGTTVFGFETRKVLSFRSLSPWDVYPSPEAKDIGDGPLCIAVRYSGSELASAGKSGVDGGWSAGGVRRLLAVNPAGWRDMMRGGSEQERQRLEGNGNEGLFGGEGCSYDGIKVYAVLRGSVLMKNGVGRHCGKRLDEARFYMLEVVTVADEVVFCSVSDNLRMPVSKGVFYDTPGSFWGRSIADRCSVAQVLQDKGLHLLCRNMELSALPMFYMRDFSNLLDKGPGCMDVKAGRMWPLRGAGLGAAGGPPIGTIDGLE